MRQRGQHTEPLTVIWDNSPAHRGDALRAYLTTPDLNLRLVNLPSYSPDFNADEVIWGWARQEATANLCLGTRAAVQEKVGGLFRPPVQPSGGSQAPLPDRAASTSGRINGPQPNRLAAPCNCRFHLGFSLVVYELLSLPQPFLVPLKRTALDCSWPQFLGSG